MRSGRKLFISVVRNRIKVSQEGLFGSENKISDTNNVLFDVRQRARDGAVSIGISAFVLTDKPARSPRKLFIFIVQNNMYVIKVSQKDVFGFENNISDSSDLINDVSQRARHGAVSIRISGCVLANKPVRSTRKLFIFIVHNNIYVIEVSQKDVFGFENHISDSSDLINDVSHRVRYGAVPMGISVFVLADKLVMSLRK